MNLFPFFENIEGRRFLIIGGGRTAKQKLSVLRRFTDRITLVAEETDLADDAGTSAGLADDAGAGQNLADGAGASADQADNTGAAPELRILRKRFAPEDLELGDYIVAATGDRELNREISRLAKESGKPVNVVDDAELCTFFFPALVRRGGLVVAVSTSGKSPAYAGHLRREIEERLPENIEEILDTLERCRSWLPEILPEQKDRRMFLKELMRGLLRGEVSCCGTGAESAAPGPAESTAPGPAESAAEEPAESAAPGPAESAAEEPAESAAPGPAERVSAAAPEDGCEGALRAMAEEFRDRRLIQ